MNFGDAFSLLYIAAMMVLGFYFIYSLFMRESLSRRVLFSIVYFILFMSIGAISISYIVFWNGSVIAGVLSLAIATFFFIPVAGSENITVKWRENRKYSMILVLSLVFLEISMGFFYASVFMVHNQNPLIMSVNNVDFAVMMFADAIFFFLISGRKRSISEVALFTFAVSMALMPDFYLGFVPEVVISSTILSASAMAINIVLLYVIQMRKRTMDMQILALVLAGSDLTMMIGLSSFVVSSELYTLTAAMIFSMLSYFFLVTYRMRKQAVRNSGKYAFILLLLINGAELAMSFADTSLGSVLSNRVFPAVAGSGSTYFTLLSPGMIKQINFSNPFWWLFPFSPKAITDMAFKMGSGVNFLFAYFWSSFMLIMSTTMSPFYAIMMGSEMSYLVFERYRKTKNAGLKKWTLGIIAGIPVFVVFIPFYTPFYIFGMSGMLFSVLLTLFIISVVAVLAASALFGRRVQCNLVCMAAHMWTNSYYDQFKAKKSSSSWKYTRWFFFSLMIVAFTVFILQDSGFMGALKVGMITINPLDFYGMFVLNYIWWFFYFLTPVFGTYSCARQGWCGFGTLAGIFNKLFFKIRASDTEICRTCTTRICEKSCPTVIPVNRDIVTRGYSNRIACIGCGNCVESCEFGNLFITDIRNVLKSG